MAEKKITYDPVTAPVPGVDQQKRAEELAQLRASGDPIRPKEEPKKRVISLWGGAIRITR